MSDRSLHELVRVVVEVLFKLKEFKVTPAIIAFAHRVVTLASSHELSPFIVLRSQGLYASVEFCVTKLIAQFNNTVHDLMPFSLTFRPRYSSI